MGTRGAATTAGSGDTGNAAGGLQRRRGAATTTAAGDTGNDAGTSFPGRESYPGCPARPDRIDRRDGQMMTAPGTKKWTRPVAMDRMPSGSL